MDEAYQGIEGFLCEAIHMAHRSRTVWSMMWTVTMKTPRWQLSFAVGHSRQLLEDLRRRYLKNDWRYHHEQEN